MNQHEKIRIFAKNYAPPKETPMINLDVEERKLLNQLLMKANKNLEDDAFRPDDEKTELSKRIKAINQKLIASDYVAPKPLEVAPKELVVKREGKPDLIYSIKS